MREGRASIDVDVSLHKPSPARMYDYYLGGKDHYEVDRKAAEEVLAVLPEIRARARENRAFLQRVVRFLAAEAGIRQFIDIGTGLPTQGNVHEIAQRAAPDARVVYSDNDPVVLNHAKALLAEDDQTIAVEADVREPEVLLGNADVRELIDFDEPVGVLCVAVLNFVADEEDPPGIVARLRAAMAPGSYLALSHGSPRSHHAAQEVAHAVKQVYERATSQARLRTLEQIRSFFEGFELLEPGLVDVAEWRPDAPGEAERIVIGSFVGGVGRKP